MLYEINENQELVKARFKRFDKEKDLENLLARNMQILFVENGLLKICQESQWEGTQDITAIDADGRVYIFELKRESVDENSINQILRYATRYIGVDYEYLNRRFQKSNNGSLKDEFRKCFEKDIPESMYNQSQKLVLVGLDADYAVTQKISYWNNTGVDITFIPYRLFEFDSKTFIEISSLPFDNQLHTSIKGIIFDTNSSYSEYVDTHEHTDSTRYMLDSEKVSAWGGASRFIHSFNKQDYAFLYKSGVGIIAYGIVSDQKPDDRFQNELFRKLDDFHSIEENPISASELKSLLGHNFFFANTTKRPYLAENECRILSDEVKKRCR